MKNINEALENLVEAMKADYIDWMTRCDLARGNTELSDISANMIADKDYVITEGRNYYKIVSVDRSQRMCAGFVCKVANEKKGFEVGDLLMSAGWSAPATNFARGNVFDLETAVNRGNVRWTGIL
jgi:hypothetical protein